MSRLYDVVRELSGQSANISISRPYIAFFKGNYNHAAVLSQLVFWSSTKSKGDWFYKSNDELATELSLSVDQIRNSVRQIKSKLDGVVTTKLKKANGVPTMHYSIDGDALVDLLFPPAEQISQMDLVNLPNGNGGSTESNREISQNLGFGTSTDSINRSEPYTNKQIFLAPSEPLDAEPALFEIPLNRKGEFHGVTQPDIDRYADLFGAVNVRAELKKMIAWCDANPRKRKTKQGVEKFIQNWLGREQDKGRYLPPEQAKTPVDTQDEASSILREVALIESDINSENRRMLSLIDAKRPQHEVDPSKRKIADLSAKRRELLDRVANLEALQG